MIFVKFEKLENFEHFACTEAPSPYTRLIYPLCTLSLVAVVAVVNTTNKTGVLFYNIMFAFLILKSNHRYLTRLYFYSAYMV